MVKRKFKSFENRNYVLPIWGLLVGTACGFVVSLFRFALQYGNDMRGTIIELAKEQTSWVAIGILIFSFLFVMAVLAVKTVPLSSGSGVPQVKGELAGDIEQVWWKIIISKFIGCFATISAGLAVGKEGASTQLGAMTGKGIACAFNRSDDEKKMMITCGAAAGLAGAFCAPIAGTVFALEELHKKFSTSVMISAMASSIAADFIAKNIFGLEPIFSLQFDEHLPMGDYWQILLLGVCVGIFGVIYNWSIAIAKKLFSKVNIKNGNKDFSLWFRFSIPFAITLVVIKVYPYVLGSGEAIVQDMSSGNYTIVFLTLLLITKLLFSAVSYGSGVAGGIFLSPFVMGAIAGSLYIQVLNAIGISEGYTEFFVVLGMAGCFAAIVRSPVTGVIILAEMTGTLTNVIPLAFVALIAFTTAGLLKGEPIYDELLENLLSANSKKHIRE